MRGLWRHCTDERGIASVMAIFIMVLLLVSGIFLVRMSSTEGDIAYGTMWAEGSFFAADAGINVGLDTIVPGGPTCAQAATSIGAFSYTVAAGAGADANCFLNTTQLRLLQLRGHRRRNWSPERPAHDRRPSNLRARCPVRS